jgi:hypothetical protein
MKVLRHRSDVPRFRFVIVTPFADRQGGDALQNLFGVDGNDIVLGVAITNGARIVRAELSAGRYRLATAACHAVAARHIS